MAPFVFYISYKAEFNIIMLFSNFFTNNLMEVVQRILRKNYQMYLFIFLKNKSELFLDLRFF